MSDASNFLNRFFAKAATNLPDYIGQGFLGGGVLGNWYENNGCFKFQPEQKIDLKDSGIAGYGPNARGWTVKGYDGNSYLIETAKGQTQKHFKWNIEFHFKLADPSAKSFELNLERQP